MLNALRHQRFDHSIEISNQTTSTVCSTPYGIRGLITSLSGVLVVFVGVLNALRHQRFDHAKSPLSIIHAYLCSTPYGIRGLITPPLETLTGQAPKWNLTSILADRPASAKTSPPIALLPIAQPLPHLPFSHLQASPKIPKIAKPKPHQHSAPFQPLAPPPPPQVLVFGQQARPIAPARSRSMPKARSPHWPQTIQSAKAN